MKSKSYICEHIIILHKKSRPNSAFFYVYATKVFDNLHVFVIF